MRGDGLGQPWAFARFLEASWNRLARLEADLQRCRDVVAQLGPPAQGSREADADSLASLCAPRVKFQGAVVGDVRVPAVRGVYGLAVAFGESIARDVGVPPEFQAVFRLGGQVVRSSADYVAALREPGCQLDVRDARLFSRSEQQELLTIFQQRASALEAELHRAMALAERFGGSEALRQLAPRADGLEATRAPVREPIALQRPVASDAGAPHHLLIEHRGEAFRWDVGDLLAPGAAPFNDVEAVLRDNVQHYFGIPSAHQVFCDGDGRELRSPGDLTEALLQQAAGAAGDARIIVADQRDGRGAPPRERASSASRARAGNGWIKEPLATRSASGDTCGGSGGSWAYGQAPMVVGGDADGLHAERWAAGLADSRQSEVAAYVRHGAALMRQGNPSKAVTYFDRALGLQPLDAAGLALRAAAKLILGRYSEAAEDCDEALALEPRDAFSMSIRGGAMVGLGWLKQARQDLDAALALQPSEAFASLMRGVALRGQGFLALATADVEQSLAAEPEDGLAHLNRAQLLLDQGRPLEALQDFDAALGVDPENGQVLIMRAAVVHQLSLLGQLRCSGSGARPPFVADCGCLGATATA